MALGLFHNSKWHIARREKGSQNHYLGLDFQLVLLKFVFQQSFQKVEISREMNLISIFLNLQNIFLELQLYALLFVISAAFFKKKAFK